MLRNLPVELLLEIAGYLGLEGRKLRLCREIEETLNSITYMPYFFYRSPYLSIGSGIPLSESPECTLFLVPEPRYIDWVRKPYLDRWASESGMKFRYRRKGTEESFSLMNMPERSGKSIRFTGYAYPMVEGFRESHVILYEMTPALYSQVKEYFGKLTPRKPAVQYVRRVIYFHPNGCFDFRNEWRYSGRVKAIASMYVEIGSTYVDTARNRPHTFRLCYFRKPERVQRILAVLEKQRIEYGL